jgi:hypothetical protein
VRSRSRFFAGAALCTVAAAACSSFESSPDVADPTVEGGTTPEASAEAEAATTDAAVGTDSARPDAGPPFCTTFDADAAPDFCVDFETKNPLTYFFPEGTGNIKIVPNAAYAGFYSLLAMASSGNYATAIRSINTISPARITLTYRVRVKALDGGSGTAVVSRIRMDDKCTFEIRLSPTNAYFFQKLESSLTGTEYLLNNDPGPDTWFEIAVELARSGATGAVGARVRIDGKESLVATEVQTACPNPYLNGVARIEIGATSLTTPFEIGFDNIVFDSE